ncbi:MAG TPA: 30S ribosome-binding factor RbfA [Roseiarcus sp.]|nr:30S ribosome-binding factor RbfA [Roseiarcus sp.]
MPRSGHKTASPSQRLLRVAEAVRHAAVEALARGHFEEPALASRSLTIREVKMSPDLRLATLSVMPLGGKARPETLAALERNKKALRAEVARRVNLKFAPDLRFVLDDSYDAQARIDALLRSPKVVRDLDREPKTDTKAEKGA